MILEVISTYLVDILLFINETLACIVSLQLPKLTVYNKPHLCIK